MSHSVSQGVYSPLPQTISDTDSEEELHSAIPIQSAKLKDGKHLNGTDLRDYYHLDDVEDTHLNGFPNINTNMLDDAPMIKDGYRKPMSHIRKLFFSLSILICFLTIVVFLWVLPCSEDETCPSVSHQTKTSSWEKPYHGIELMGPINVVKGVTGHSNNLVFLFRGDVINPNPIQGLQNIPPKGGGAICIMGETGKVAWYVPRQRLASEIDCTLLDVDNNGDTDCIMAGESGLLEAINPLSGAIQWYLHIHNTTTTTIITSVDFPRLILDVDNDHVNDLVTSCSLNGSNHNILVIASGRVGNVLGTPHIVKDCDTVHKLEIDQNFLSYFCQKGLEIKKSFMSLHDFYFQVFNRTMMKSNITIKKQHSESNSHGDQRMIYSVNGRQLIVNNQGRCPGSCSVSVQLIDQRFNRAGNVMWSYNGTDMYGMVPAKLTFKSSENNINSLQGHVNGFILKFWQWYSTKSDRSYNRDYFSTEKIVKRNLLDNITNLKLAWYFPVVRLKRSLPLVDFRNVSVTEQMLTERVVLITFNSSTFNIVNASQSDVKQLCAQNLERMYCQPDLSLQENSVLIDDLDGDGSKELISYLSTFSGDYDEHENVKYQLQSSIKVIRLESELPKLYEAVTKY
ncbi:uncharacterized protein CBL_14124 [Carabus blaptoides fortunei]